uniref:hypothetical protein n=1 Tax=Spirosoma panaciterrae TaxID=496058 RepID=UPI00059335B1
MLWSKPISYDLTRTPRRVSVPKGLTEQVPAAPGIYVIIQTGENKIETSIIDIGLAGLRDGNGTSKPKGLRGRIANTCAHSASEKIAEDIKGEKLSGQIKIIWLTTATELEAKELEAGLIKLFEREFGRRPQYNTRNAISKNPQRFLGDMVLKIRTRNFLTSCTMNQSQRPKRKYTAEF